MPYHRDPHRSSFFLQAPTLLISLCSLLLVACGNQPTNQESNQRPNILLIVADDLGYTDLGIYGGEIPTPNLDKLAGDGLQLTSYYSAPLCAPTRAELMSGVDHHRSGEGLMGIAIANSPGYEGRLNQRVVTLPEHLSANGYHTFMAGKWHLGKAQGQRPAERGFQRSFIMTDGGSSHYADGINGLSGETTAYYQDGEPLHRLPEDFYSTDAYTRQTIAYIESQRNDDRPFFAYLAYTAPHWPIQAPAEDVAAFRGQYDEGFEVLRQQRFQRWKAAGMATDDAELPHLPENYPRWASLTEDQQKISARTMETYAAMVSGLDRQIGELIRFLKDSGELENTLIIFQSDNGAEATSGYPLPGPRPDNSLANIGKPGSFAYLGPGWAEAGSAPFRQNKTYTTEGGIRVPAFVYGPELGVPAGRSDALLVSYDLVPTLLEFTASSPLQRADSLTMDGRSFAPLLRAEPLVDGRGPDDVVGREHAGHGTIRKGDWKLVWENRQSFYMGRDPRAGEPHAYSGNVIARDRFTAGIPEGYPIGQGGPWKLFNIRRDPAERHDLSAEHPDIVDDLLREWQRYTTDFGVITREGVADQ